MIKPTISQRLELRQQPQNEFPVMKHKWRDLLFLHWEYDAMALQQTLPEGLYVDTFDNKAYIGITPLFLYDVRPILLPSIPAISDFREVNVRTYVHDKNGVPGVWFYSLDANQRIAVNLARQINLPYYHSNIAATKQAATGEILYRAERENIPIDKNSTFRYAPKGKDFFAQSDSLEFFLVERYLLYTYNKHKGRLVKGRVYHMSYPLYQAEVTEWDANLIELDNLQKPLQAPDHIIFSPGVDVGIYFFKPVY